MHSFPVGRREPGVRRLARAAGAVLLVGLAAGIPAPASAAPGGSIDQAAGKADTVFTATVVTSAQDTVGHGRKARQVTRYTARVDRVYQGSVSKESVLVTSRLTADCGYGAIPTGKPWVFFVTGRGDRFFGNFCAGTAPATDRYLGKVEKVLGPGEPVVAEVPPRPPLTYTDEDTSTPPTLTRMLVPGGAITLIGLLGLVLARGRRARAA